MNQTIHSQGFHFKEFSKLDSSPDADYLINSMEVMSSLDSIQAIKNRAIKAMRLKRGERVLEVGCGHGQDAEAIGKIVGNTGSVIAIDLSQRMIHEAIRRSKLKQVKHLVLDVANLHFQDHFFSACHADRFLVSQENYQNIFKKILRVIKPGGVVCFTDVDALSIVISPYNATTQCIMDFLRKGFVNPHIGRDLLSLFIEHKLENIKVIPETSMIRSWDTLNEIFQFSTIAQSAINAEKLSPQEAQQWKEDMEKAEQRGEFLYCITFFTVIGHLPS